MLTNDIILMNQVCRAYPQEWCSLVDSLEYLCDTEPQGDFGLSAHDMATGYALVGEVDQRLAPFYDSYGHSSDGVSGESVRSL